MRVDFLHRRVLSDIQALQRDIQHILPETMPGQYQTRASNIGALVKRLNVLTTPHGIRNQVTKIDRHVTYQPGRLRFCGEWSPDELRDARRPNEDITIHWLVDRSTRRVVFTPTKWSFYMFSYWVYVMHELVHRHQNNTRSQDASCRIYRPAAKEAENRSLHDEQRYLGEYDEIEAHAHDIAFELLAFYPDLPLREALPMMRKTAATGLITYPIYQHAFSGVRKHPVMPALHRKIRLWYRQLKQHRDVYETLGMFPMARRVIELTQPDF